MASKTLKLEDFELLRIIGRGIGTEVWSAHKKADESGKIFAIKIMKKKTRQKAYLAREMKALRELGKEALIIGYHGAINTKTDYCLVMDYAPGGDLYDLMRHNVFSLHAIRFYLAEIVQALGKVHMNLIVHQDLKPENILVDAEGHLLLADFGLCHILSDRTRGKWKVGSSAFMAPEVLESWRKLGVCDLARDWYAVGVLGLQMVCGVNYLPYGEQVLPHSQMATANEIEKSLLRGMETGVPNIPSSVDGDLKDLLAQLLAVNCRQRLGLYGAFQVKAHQFFKGMDWDGVEKKRVTPPFPPQTEAERLSKETSKSSQSDSTLSSV